MNLSLINQLVNKASKFGAQGYEVVQWIPPSTATQDETGTLVIRKPPINSASETPWYNR